MRFQRNVVSAICRQPLTRTRQSEFFCRHLASASSNCENKRYFSSSFLEPTLFHPERVSTPTEELELDVQLRADVKSMGSVLGETIKTYSGEQVFDKVELLRKSAKAWREAGAGRDQSKMSECESAFQSMCKTAAELSDEELKVVSRAFSHFCAIANAAEYHHRSRKNEHRLRQNAGQNSSLGALVIASDSCGGVLPDLIKNKGLSAKEIYDTLVSQQVELVLTAHPTEVNRRTLLEKHRRVQEKLTQADKERSHGIVTPYQSQIIDDGLKREISLIWQSDELSRQKPTVQSEAERGTLVVEQVLWEALPNFLRKLDATMSDTLGDDYGLPIGAAPIKFSSWMGGDR